MLTGERTALNLEVQRAKELSLQALLTCPAAVQYFNKIEDAICAALEADEATDRASELHQQLMVHDRKFSDLDPSKYDAERSAIDREIRHQSARVIQLQRQVERSKTVDSMTAKTVNAFMDDLGRPSEDAFRPANFLMQTCRWTAPELDRLILEVELAEDKPRSFDSNATELADFDSQSFLRLVSAEIDVSRQYIEICDKIDTLASKVCGELRGFEYEKDALVRACASYPLRPEEVSNKISELAREYSDRGREDLGLQVLLNRRAKLIVQLEQTRTTMAERADQFVSALNAKSIPQTSLLRTAISSLKPVIESDASHRKIAVTERGFVKVIGEWWEEWHKKNSDLPEEAWDDLAKTLTSRRFLLEDFLSKKRAIKRTVEAVQPAIRDWWQLSAFVKRPGAKSAKLRRILQQRFWEIYTRQYVPLFKPDEKK
jgi:hypothetical protein